MIYNIPPVAKPRMTRSDKWKKRPATKKYWAFCDMVRANKVKFESGDHVIFHIEMPKSWSEKKRFVMDRTPHMQTPDLDNLVKALGDAIYQNDCILYDYRATKRWSETGQIEIRKQFGNILE